MMQNEEKIKALIELIDKEPSRSQELMAQLAQIIKKAPGQFKNVIKTNFGGAAPGYVKDIIGSIHRESLAMPFKWYFGRRNPELMQAVLLTAKFINPGVKEEVLLAPFNTLKESMAAQLDGGFDIFSKAGFFETFLFGELGFKLESLSTDARLLSLPDMIKRRKASPFAMAVLYALLAAGFDIWVDVIDVGGKPIVRFRDNITFEPVYIDIAAGGRFVSEDECHIYASSCGSDWDPAVLKPMDNKQALKRLLANLVYVYSKENGKAADMLRGFLRAAG